MGETFIVACNAGYGEICFTKINIGIQHLARCNPLQNLNKINIFEKKFSTWLEKTFSVIADQRVDTLISHPQLFSLSDFFATVSQKQVIIKTKTTNNLFGHLLLSLDKELLMTLYAYKTQETDISKIKKILKEEAQNIPQETLNEIIDEIQQALSLAINESNAQKIKLEKAKIIFAEPNTVPSDLDQCEEYAVCQLSNKFSQLPLQKCNLLLIRNLFESVVQEDIDLEDHTLQCIVLYSSNSQFIGQMKRDLSSRKVKI